jgi:hypothetical protein
MSALPVRAGLLILALTATEATPLLAQGASSPPILRLPVSVRVAGLGGAGVGLSGDASSVFINPAGLATIRHIAIEGTIQRYRDGTIETMGAGAFRLLQFDLGGGYHYMRFSDSSATKDNLSWVGSAVYRFGIVALGSGVRYVSEEDSVGEVRRSGAVDGGLGIYLFDLMTIAFAVRNIGQWSVTGQPLDMPVSSRLGFTFNFVDPLETARLLGTVEVDWTQGEPRRTMLGVEAGAVIGDVGLVARAGYGAVPEAPSDKNVSLGAGLVLTRVTIDYAWQPHAGFGGDAHRLGLRLTL